MAIKELGEAAGSMAVRRKETRIREDRTIRMSVNQMAELLNV